MFEVFIVKKLRKLKAKEPIFVKGLLGHSDAVGFANWYLGVFKQDYLSKLFR